MAVPSPPISGDKIMLRRRAREARRAFVEALAAHEREQLERELADALRPLIATCRVLGIYAPLPDEISPLPAAELARANGATVAFPTFSDHSSPFRFLALVRSGIDACLPKSLSLLALSRIVLECIFQCYNESPLTAPPLPPACLPRYPGLGTYQLPVVQ